MIVSKTYKVTIEFDDIEPFTPAQLKEIIDEATFYPVTDINVEQI